MTVHMRWALGGLLLLFPERQKTLRRRAADHAGDADLNLPQGGGRNAAERESTDADLAPEIEITSRVRALGLQLFDGGKRVLADRTELHGIGGLDYFGERDLHRFRLVRQFAAQKLAQVRVAYGVAR